MLLQFCLKSNLWARSASELSHCNVYVYNFNSGQVVGYWKCKSNNGGFNLCNNVRLIKQKEATNSRYRFTANSGSNGALYCVQSLTRYNFFGIKPCIFIICPVGGLIEMNEEAAFFLSYFFFLTSSYCWPNCNPSVCVDMCGSKCESSGECGLAGWLAAWWLSLLLAVLFVIFPLAMQGVGVCWACCALCGDQRDPQNSQHTAEVTQADPTKLNKVYWSWFSPLRAQQTAPDGTSLIILCYSYFLHYSLVCRGLTEQVYISSFNRPGIQWFQSSFSLVSLATPQCVPEVNPLLSCSSLYN